MPIGEAQDLREYCLRVARRAKEAAAEVALVTGAQKQDWLRRSARLLRDRVATLSEANVLAIEVPRCSNSAVRACLVVTRICQVSTRLKSPIIASAIPRTLMRRFTPPITRQIGVHNVFL